MAEEHLIPDLILDIAVDSIDPAVWDIQQIGNQTARALDKDPEPIFELGFPDIFGRVRARQLVVEKEVAVKKIRKGDAEGP